ncbi:hypothetical protein CK203_048550 [Vitis vinifera]|uniref:Disease resistance protein n=1 Tax=Vitis vinifera TaxID=29760 RepID=A0A438FX82_VITVI|nr:hypothetical protein CK203_048550 [Vitis vinifera]
MEGGTEDIIVDCNVEELKESPSFLNLETLMVSYSKAANPARETVKTKLFSIFNSMVAHGDCKALLKELECLEHLNEISIRLKRALPTQTLFKFPQVEKEHKTAKPARLCRHELCPTVPHLQMLEIYACSELRFVKISAEKEGPSDMVHPNFPSHQYFCKLREVEIVFCPRLLNLTWLAHAQNLLSWTQTLHLWSLPKLKSIYGRPLPFPSLREFNVRFCPSLRKLPFDSDTWASKNPLKSREKKNGGMDSSGRIKTVLSSLSLHVSCL